jgi:hypothetical protein
VKLAPRIAARTASPFTFWGVTEPTSTVADEGSYAAVSGVAGGGVGGAAGGGGVAFGLGAGGGACGGGVEGVLPAWLRPGGGACPLPGSGAPAGLSGAASEASGAGSAIGAMSTAGALTALTGTLDAASRCFPVPRATTSAPTPIPTTPNTMATPATQLLLRRAVGVSETPVVDATLSSLRDEWGAEIVPASAMFGTDASGDDVSDGRVIPLACSSTARRSARMSRALA